MKSGTRPPSGVKESCIALTEPFEAPVVAVAQMAELTMPKRTSFPSMLPPAWSALARLSTPRASIRGLPCCSAHTATPTPTTRMIIMAASTAHPWRVSPTILPKV